MRRGGGGRSSPCALRRWPNFFISRLNNACCCSRGARRWCRRPGAPRSPLCPPVSVVSLLGSSRCAACELLTLRGSPSRARPGAHRRLCRGNNVPRRERRVAPLRHPPDIPSTRGHSPSVPRAARGIRARRRGYRKRGYRPGTGVSSRSAAARRRLCCARRCSARDLRFAPPGLRGGGAGRVGVGAGVGEAARRAAGAAAAEGGGGAARGAEGVAPIRCPFCCCVAAPRRARHVGRRAALGSGPSARHPGCPPRV